MSANQSAGRRVWITGASQGIGRATAIEMLRRGYRVCISARDADALRVMADEYEKSQVLAIAMDVTEREANLRAVEGIVARWGGLDIALLNAGTCEYVDLPNFDSRIFEKNMNVNFIGMVYGIEAALPELRKSKGAQLVGVSSAARYVPLPRAEAYGASKIAIHYMLESLRLDLAPSNIDVTIISPGFVKTPLTDRNDFQMPMIMDAERAARIIVDGIEKRKANIDFPLLFTLIMKILALLPAPLYRVVAQRMVRK